MRGNGREMLLLRLLLLLLALQLLVQIVLRGGVHDSAWIPPLYAGRRCGRCAGYAGGAAATGTRTRTTAAAAAAATAGALSRTRRTEPVIVSTPHARGAAAARRGCRHRTRYRAGGGRVLEAGGHFVGEELVHRGGSTSDVVRMVL